MRLTWLAGLAIGLAGCASATPEASRVTIVNDRAAVAKCVALGQLQSASHWGGFAATGVGQDDAMASLRNQAAERGGTHLLLVMNSNTMGGTRMLGDAYRC